MQKLSLLISSLLFLGISGCNLEEVIEKGETCPPSNAIGTLSYIGDVNCTAALCSLGNYQEYFDHNVCPLDYPECNERNGKYFCSKYSCKNDEYLDDTGNCQQNSVTHCGSMNNNCTQYPGWQDGVCSNGICVAMSCTEAYKLENDQCVADKDVCGKGTHQHESGCENDTIEHCGSHDNNCTGIPGWLNGRCENEQCQIDTCESGYNLTNNRCEKIVECNSNADCSILNGAGTCDPNTNTCEFKCNDNYLLTAENKCEKDPCVEISCNPVVHAKVYCMDGECKFDCVAEYHKNGDQCVPDDPCKDIKCDINNGTGTCENGSCKYSCNTGYKLSGSSCVKIDLCEGKDCSIANGAGTCSNGICSYSCNAGYKLSGSTCVKVDPCEGKTCSISNGTGTCSNGTCSYTCNTGYKLSGSTCVKVDPCEGKTCSIANGTGTCSNGTCSYSCNTGYKLSGSTCVKVDPCEGKNCSITNGRGTCSNGTCSYTCNTGYYLKDNTTCAANNNSNCGAQGKACTGGMTCQSGSCQCPAGMGYNKFTKVCVLKQCENIPGVTKAVSCYNNQCLPTECASDYMLDSTGCLNPTYNSFGQCLPLCKTAADCQSKTGLKNLKCEQGICQSHSDSDCSDGYRHYSMTCVPASCCGGTCQNCAMSGKSCSGGSTGQCI